MIKLEHKTMLKSPLILVANPKNVVEHPPEQIYALVKAFARFGFIGSVVIGSDNLILKGHGCVEAAIEAGMKKIPVIDVSHLTEDEQDAYMISENKISEMKLYDEDALNEELSRLLSLDFDFAELGLDGTEFEIEALETSATYIPGEHEERKDGEVDPDEDFDTDGNRDKDFEHDLAEEISIPEIRPLRDLKNEAKRTTRCPNCSHEFSPVKRSCAA